MTTDVDRLVFLGRGVPGKTPQRVLFEAGLIEAPTREAMVEFMISANAEMLAEGLASKVDSDYAAVAVTDQIEALKSAVGARASRRWMGGLDAPGGLALFGVNPGTGGFMMAFRELIGAFTGDRRSRRYHDHYQDQTGRVFAATDLDGTQLTTIKIPNPLQRAVGHGWAWVRDLAGKWLVWFEPDGSLSFAASRFTRQSMLTNASVIRGPWRKLGTWPISDTLNGVLVQGPDGTVTRGRQIRSGQLSTVVAEHDDDERKPMIPVLVIGQSNSLPSSGSVDGVSYSSIQPKALFPTKVLRPEGVSVIYGDPPYAAMSVFYDLTPAADDQSGNGPLNSMLNAAVGQALAAGEASPAYSGVVVGRGGYGLDAFLPGGVHPGGGPNGFIWNSILLAIRGLPLGPTRYGFGARPIVRIVHGESGPPGRTAYGTKLDGFLTAISDAFFALWGVRPLFLIDQTNVQEDGDITLADGVALAQQDVAEARADAFLTCPMYWLSFHPDTPDEPGKEIHVDNLDRLAHGDVAGIALRSILNTGAWNPTCRSADPTRVGATITQLIQLPPGGLPLQIDGDRVPDSAQGLHGWRLFRASDGSEVEIADVTVATGPDRIIIEAAVDPAEPVDTDYADDFDDMSPHWAASRGQIYSPANEPSFWAGQGFEVPDPPRHYLTRSRRRTTS